MFRTTKEIFDRLNSFDESLRNIYFNIENIDEKEKLDLALAFMDQHTTRLKENLKLFEEDSSDNVQVIGLKYISEDDLPKECNIFKNNEKIDVSEVIDMALKFDECLINIYQKVVENCPYPETVKVFENLLHLAKRERLDIIKDEHNTFFVERFN